MSCENVEKFWGEDSMSQVVGTDIDIDYQLVTDVTTAQYPNGTPINITGWTFRFGVKRQKSDVAYIISPVQATVSITNAAEGTIKITVSDAITSNIEAGIYYFELETTKPSNIIQTLILGTIEFVEKLID